MKKEDQKRLLAHVGRYVRAKFGVNATRIAELERRVRSMELKSQSEQRGFFYKGVWSEGEQYTEGDFVTDHGSLWHCNVPTRDRPGTSDCWQLAVKAGRPGRDARGSR